MRREIEEKRRRENRELFAGQWGRILEHSSRELLKSALRITYDRSAAEDLVQDLACRVLYYAPDPRRYERNPMGYFVTTMKRLWIDRWKKHEHVIMQSLDDPDNDIPNELPFVEPSVLRKLEHYEMKHRLLKALHDTRPVERKILLLYLQGDNCAEIAEELGLAGKWKEPLAYIRSVLNAVKTKIRYRVKISDPGRIESRSPFGTRSGAYRTDTTLAEDAEDMAVPERSHLGSEHGRHSRPGAMPRVSAMAGASR